MSTDPEKIISLTELQNEIAGQVEINGQKFKVRRFNVGEYQAVLRGQRQDDPDAKLETSVQLIGKVTAMPIEQVRELQPVVMEAIVTLATQGIEAVEALLPNVPSPEQSSTSPG